MGGKRIDCYLDISSFFSYVALLDMLPNLDRLAAHGVEVEFHPVFLGGINHITGNKPPWTLPAKATYLKFDSKRAADRVSLPEYATPPDFMARANTVSVLRVLHFIKANYPTPVFMSTLRFFYHKYWTPPNTNLTDDATLAATLAEATQTPQGGSKLFSQADVKKIMEGRAQMKDSVKNETAKAVELGAFGAPWFWVSDAQGRTAPFFGSDRFNHIYEHLGIQYQDVSVLAPSKL